MMVCKTPSVPLKGEAIGWVVVVIVGLVPVGILDAGILGKKKLGFKGN